MNPGEPTPSWKAKHAWREVPLETPPKRPAQQRVADFHEIYSLFDEATVREQASRCIQCPTPQCVTGCPLSNRIPEWITLAAEGQFLEAAAISRATSNMPEICSRVCPQERLCEGSCILNARSDPVCIGAIERFINEYAFAHGAVEAEPAPSNGFRVAVVGSGPGGLACADELAKRGYAVTVFESQSLPGGLLVNGIPSFKEPSSENAGRTLVIMVTLLCTMFLGITFLANHFPIVVHAHAESGGAAGELQAQRDGLAPKLYVAGFGGFFLSRSCFTG